MLTDRFGRTVDYLRISVTEHCDLRCSYCLPRDFKEFAQPKDWLTFAEIQRVVATFARLGTRRFRITGGEPLLRRDLPVLITQLAAITGVDDLSLTTNGTRLSRYAHTLRTAGVHRLNVSLDSLRDDCLHGITGRACLTRILDGLQAAREAGFTQIKINMVPLAGINEDDIEPMVAFCIQHGLILRLIEAMPMGSSGQHIRRVALEPILQRLQQRFHLQASCKNLGGGPARYWETGDGSFTLGLITPLSQHFCATCNRVRLSAQGVLYLCLGQEEHVDLRPLLRTGCSNFELEMAIRNAIELKPQQHHFLDTSKQVVRFMSMTGG